MATALRVMLWGLCLVAGGAARAGTVPLAGDQGKARQVWAAFEAWLAAYERGDLDAVMRIFGRDVVFTWPGEPDQGWNRLRAIYAADFERRPPGARWEARVQEVHADARLAFVRATWELAITGPDGRREVKSRNRSLDVLRLDSDGAWVIFRSVNFPETGDADRVAPTP